MRLPVETPVRQALEEYERPVRKPKGKQKKTWYHMVKTELKEIAVDAVVDVAAAGGGGGIKHTQERKAWKALICHPMSL